MKHEKISPAGATNGADVHCSEQTPYTAKAGKSQSDFLERRVTGLGPVHLIARTHCPPPSVVIRLYSDKAVVFCENAPWSPPWGEGSGAMTFLNPNGKAVEHYALTLGAMIRDRALAEQAFKERQRELRWRERMDRKGGA